MRVYCLYSFDNDDWRSAEEEAEYWRAALRAEVVVPWTSFNGLLRNEGCVEMVETLGEPWIVAIVGVVEFDVLFVAMLLEKPLFPLWLLVNKPAVVEETVVPVTTEAVLAIAAKAIAGWLWAAAAR